MKAGLRKGAITAAPGARARRAHGAPGARGRWIVLGLLVLGVAAALAVAVSSLSLQSDRARQEIRQRLAALTGLPVTIEGAAGFTLLPRTTLTLTKIRIGSPDSGEDGVLRIDALRADLNLWQALLGRARVKRLTLIRPELLSTSHFLMAASSPPAVPGSPGPAGGADEREGSLAAMKVMGTLLARFGDLRTIEVSDGVFRMGPEPSGLGISNANVVVSWHAPQSAARLTGSYVWNGEPTEIDLRLGAPLDFLAGKASAVNFGLSAPPLRVSFKGRAAPDSAEGLSGRVQLSAPSLPRSLRWLGETPVAPPDLGPMSVDADLAMSGEALALRDAKVSLDGHSGQGALEMLVRADGRPSLGGTLDFARLDLDELGEAVAPFPDNPFDLQRRIPVAFVDRLDLDLRISVGRATLGALPVDDLAAILTFKDGVATVDVGDAAMLGGRGDARFTVDTRTPAPVLKGSMALSGVNTPALLAAAGVAAFGISGLSDISADVEAPATSWADVFRTSRATLDMTARGGTLTGIDPALFSAEGTRPLVPAAPEAAIAFQSMRARLKTVGPAVSIQWLSVKGPSGDVTAGGVASTADRTVDIKGAFRPATTDAAPPGAFTAPQPIPFRVQGAWPRFTVTAGSPAKPI